MFLARQSYRTSFAVNFRSLRRITVNHCIAIFNLAALLACEKVVLAIAKIHYKST